MALLYSAEIAKMRMFSNSDEEILSMTFPQVSKPSMDWLRQWSFVHALLMLAATVLSVALPKPQLVPVTGLLSFMVLVSLGMKNSSFRHIIQPANGLTQVRLGIILFLGARGAAWSEFWIVAAGLVLILADGLDGWVARKTYKESELGEFLDKETDALYVLVLCLLLVTRSMLGAWILVNGLLRYVFVVSLLVLKPVRTKEDRTLRARRIHTFVLLLLLALFIIPQTAWVLFAAGATGLLLFSFAVDIKNIFFRKLKPAPQI